MTAASRPFWHERGTLAGCKLPVRAGSNPSWHACCERLTIAVGPGVAHLADALLPTDPGTAAEAARTAAGQLRRVGDRGALAVALINLAEALLMLGDWDTAEPELTRPADSDALADNEVLVSERCLLAALRGDASAAETMLATLTDMRASEDPQDKAAISGIEGFIAAARRQPHTALRQAGATLARASPRCQRRRRRALRRQNSRPPARHMRI